MKPQIFTALTILLLTSTTLSACWEETDSITGLGPVVWTYIKATKSAMVIFSEPLESINVRTDFKLYIDATELTYGTDYAIDMSPARSWFNITLVNELADGKKLVLAGKDGNSANFNIQNYGKNLTYTGAALEICHQGPLDDTKVITLNYTDQAEQSVDFIGSNPAEDLPEPINLKTFSFMVLNRAFVGGEVTRPIEAMARVEKGILTVLLRLTGYDAGDYEVAIFPNRQHDFSNSTSKANDDIVKYSSTVQIYKFVLLAAGSVINKMFALAVLGVSALLM